MHRKDRGIQHRCPGSHKLRVCTYVLRHMLEICMACKTRRLEIEATQTSKPLIQVFDKPPTFSVATILNLDSQKVLGSWPYQSCQPCKDLMSVAGYGLFQGLIAYTVLIAMGKYPQPLLTHCSAISPLRKAKQTRSHLYNRMHHLVGTWHECISTFPNFHTCQSAADPGQPRP